MAPWSKYAGRKASKLRPSSRVRVYERPDVEGRIYVSRAWIHTASGRPEERPLPEGTTREEAWLVCQQTALEREKAILHGRALPESRAVTLGKLLELYHDSTVVRKWSKRHAVNQELPKRFWLEVLGEDAVVEQLTTARVESEARRGAKRAGWSPRTEERYLVYLHAAVRWGQRKARLYDVDPLMGLETPTSRPDTTDRIYTTAEIKKLVTPHEDVDWRVTLGASIAFDTGRRLSAFRHLKTDDLRVVQIDDIERLLLVFRAAHDKARRPSLVPVSKETAVLIATALERREVQAHGFLFPGGDEVRTSYWRQPIGRDSLITLLHEAEDTLKIERVKHRGFHGIKRLHVTVGMEEGDVELVSDTTGNVNPDVLRRIYRQQNVGRTASQVDRLRVRLEE